MFLDQEEAKPLSFETPNGNYLEVIQAKEKPGLYKIRFKTGGEVVDELKGYWTSKHLAAARVQRYLDILKDTKAPSNAKVKSK